MSTIFGGLISLKGNSFLGNKNVAFATFQIKIKKCKSQNLTFHFLFLFILNDGNKKTVFFYESLFSRAEQAWNEQTLVKRLWKEERGEDLEVRQI